MSDFAPDAAYLDAILQWGEQQEQAQNEAAQDQAANRDWHKEPTAEEKWAMWDYYENQNNQENER